MEAELMAKLHRHPNLPHFYGIAEGGDEGTITLVMEYCPMGSLDVYLEENTGEVELKDKLDMSRQLCNAMKELSSQSIIHCDLAARNVLLVSTKPRFHVKVTDFGLSKESPETYYGSGVRDRPVRWCPPEVLKKNKYSEKSDVWAFGVTLWEIYSDADAMPFFTLSSDEEVIARVVKGERLEQPDECPDEV